MRPLSFLAFVQSHLFTCAHRHHRLQVKTLRRCMIMEILFRNGVREKGMEHGYVFFSLPVLTMHSNTILSNHPFEQSSRHHRMLNYMYTSGTWVHSENSTDIVTTPAMMMDSLRTCHMALTKNNFSSTTQPRPSMPSAQLLKHPHLVEKLPNVRSADRLTVASKL